MRDERKRDQNRSSASSAPVSPNSERLLKQSSQASVPFGFHVTKSVNGARKQKENRNDRSVRNSAQFRAGSAILETTEREGTPFTSVRRASVARSLKSSSHDDLKLPFAELKQDPQDEAASEVPRDGILTVKGRLIMIELFNGDARAARIYLRVMDNIEMCSPWLEPQLQKIQGDGWEDCMMWVSGEKAMGIGYREGL